MTNTSAGRVSSKTPAYRSTEPADRLVHYPGADLELPPEYAHSLTFHDRTQAFLDGGDSPRDYLERCLDTIARREPVVQGWVVLNEAGAREAADASARRYREGRPLSAIDGMPVGIKDLIETRDMPTQMGSPAYTGNFPKRDSAVVRALREAGAIVLGKTVTTALGFLDPGPTTNAFDPERTPGLVQRLGRRGGRQHGAGGGRLATGRLHAAAGQL